MARYRYKYNHDRLEYEKVPFKFKDYLWLFTKVVFVVGTIAVAAVFLNSKFFDSHKEIAQQREIEFLNAQLEEMHQELDNVSSLLGEISSRDEDIYRNIFGAEPYPEHLRNPGIGGVDREKYLRGFDHSEDVIEAKRKISSIQRRLVAQSKSFEELFALAQTKTEMLSTIPAIQPVRNEDLKRMASGYGFRIHPVYKVNKMHWGMDFTAPTGTDIFATGDGKVSRVERKLTGYGYNVIVKHGYGYETLYAHMSKILVYEGMKVKRGDKIGEIGNTGVSVGPHLHYEVIKDGEKVNPAYYYFNDLSPEQFEEMLLKSSNANQSFD